MGRIPAELRKKPGRWWSLQQDLDLVLSETSYLARGNPHNEVIAQATTTRLRLNTMNSEPDLLRIEVVEDEIVVSLPKSQLSVTYYRSHKSPRLLAKRITEKYDPRTPMTMSEFLAKAWKLANDRARELGWIV